MTLASELITRGLRLINVPGRGSLLSGDDMRDAFEVLQEIVSRKSVSKQFVPGIQTHFFEMQANKSIYSIGPGGELDTNDFLAMSPIKIEDAYIREGSFITQNQQVTNNTFLASNEWTQGAGWVFANGKATIAPGNIGSTLFQSLSLTPGVAYTVKFDLTHRGGTLRVQVGQDAIELFNQVYVGTGAHTAEVTFSGTTSDLNFVAEDALCDFDVNSISIIEVGKLPVSLPDSQGSDYTVKIIDQRRYNRRFSKGTGGRPYEILFSRKWPLAELRFDNSPISGDLLVLDVLTAPALNELSDTVPLHPDAITWLKYALADELAPEYGKTLKPRQIKIMDSAWDSLASGNRRRNNLRMDKGLQNRPTFDINRGDP